MKLVWMRRGAPPLAGTALFISGWVLMKFNVVSGSIRLWFVHWKPHPWRKVSNDY